MHFVDGPTTILRPSEEEQGVQGGAEKMTQLKII